MASKADETTESKASMTTEPKKGDPTHIRFIGDPGDASECVVFGKRFQRNKPVPLANLDGRNAEKKALEPDQLKKLMGNPAFVLDYGEDKPLPDEAAVAGLPAEDA